MRRFHGAAAAEALHALELAFDYPHTEERLRIVAPVPEDLAEALGAMGMLEPGHEYPGYVGAPPEGGFKQGLSLAAVNGPELCVVAGPVEAIEALELSAYRISGIDGGMITQPEFAFFFRSGGWDVRVQNKSGNWLDSTGHVPGDAAGAQAVGEGRRERDVEADVAKQASVNQTPSE